MIIFYFLFPSRLSYLTRCYRNPQRFLCILMEFLRNQVALREPPVVWVNLRPLPRPRDLLPAAVRPLNSRCFMTGRHIQFILGSRVMALWWGSIMITSKYL